MEFTWEGHQLQAVSAGGKDISYAYNSDGIRTGKTVDGVTTSYLLDGSTVIAQKTGDDVLWFLYDSDGTRVGFTYNGAAYYYMTNAQGDVTGIVDSSVNSVVEYSYDAWGKLLTTAGSMAETVGKVNPYLYRGYYYDSETGFYSLQSRYYDPETGRFINADDTDVLTASLDSPNWNKSLFAYCDNDPVNRKDEGGQLWNFIVGAVVGATSVYVGDVIGNIASGKSGWDILKPTSSVGTYLGAAASGMIPGAGIVSIITRPLISTGVKYSVDGAIFKKKVNPLDVTLDLGLNFAGEGLSIGVNKVFNKARPQNYSSFRNQLTRRIPRITQQQTKQLMYVTHRIINSIIKMAEFAIEAATNR